PSIDERTSGRSATRSATSRASDGLTARPYPSRRCAQDRLEVGDVVGVVEDRLVEEELQVVGVLHPTRLWNDGQVAPELARRFVEAATDLGHRERAPLGGDLRVDDLAGALVPVPVHALLRRARRVHRELLRDGDPVLHPGDEVGDEVAAGPVMGAGDRALELLVGQAAEGLERAPRLALFLQELERIQVHRTTLRPRRARDT